MSNNRDLLFQIIVEIPEMDGHVCGWELSSVYIEQHTTLLLAWNPIEDVQHILKHHPSKDDLLSAPVNQMGCTAKLIFTEK